MKKDIDDFKIKIGTRLKDINRDIIITEIKRDKITNIKVYRYKCNVCGFDSGKHYSIRDKKYKDELVISEYDLLRGKGCSCCNSKIIVQGINDISTTNSWMIPYIGEKCAKTHTYSSKDKVQVTCPDCRQVKNKKMMIRDIYRNHSINCICSDKISYPEKIMYSILEQIRINFKTQLSKSTFKWCNKYKYDFYFEHNNEKYIIETHGEQHYRDCKWSKLEKTQLNDEFKKELALSNGVKEENYIVIDCRKSELEWIKENILKSKLNELFDLSKIDWIEAEEFALSNLVKKACEYKKNNPELTVIEIGKIMRRGRTTICNWLKIGYTYGWCYYNVNEIMSNIGHKVGQLTKEKLSEQVEIFKEGKSLGIFESTMELERISEKLFETRLLNNAISQVCNDKWKSYKGFTFKYINKKNRNINHVNKINLVGIFKNNIVMGIFNNVYELERESEKLFDVKLLAGNIYKVCNNKRNHTGGYKIKYIKDLTPEEYIKYDIENKLKELHNRELGQVI